MDRMDKLRDFMEETIVYFNEKVRHLDRDRYFADRDIRSILDKTINDMILCLVDIAEECLKKKGRSIPDTYKDTILSCYEFVGDAALKEAPLRERRRDHQRADPAYDTQALPGCKRAY